MNADIREKPPATQDTEKLLQWIFREGESYEFANNGKVEGNSGRLGIAEYDGDGSGTSIGNQLQSLS